jgi:hypothetical protein
MCIPSERVQAKKADFGLDSILLRRLHLRLEKSARRIPAQHQGQGRADLYAGRTRAATLRP